MDSELDPDARGPSAEVTPAGLDDLERWSRPAAGPVEAAGGRLLQTAFWARLKERFGWSPGVVRVTQGGASCPVLLLSRRIGPGLVLAYAPFAPALAEPPENRETLLMDLARGAAAISGAGAVGTAGAAGAAAAVKTAAAVCLRFDLPWGRTGLGRFPEPLRPGPSLRKAALDVQPASTVVVDLAPEEDEILAAMKHKTRYNCRLAFRKGVEVEEVPAEGLEQGLGRWYGLYRATAERDRIAIHSLEYYRAQFELAREHRERHGAEGPEYKLLLARHEGSLLAGIIVALCGDTAWYLFGASGPAGRNLMPTYALQWRAMQLARAAGCRWYDLFGIPPSDDPAHPMHGLFQFKTGFGGTVVNRLGCWDVVLRPARYAVYRAAERARGFYHHVMRKRIGR